MEGTMSAAPAVAAPVVTPAALLEHWQGHRRLTRRLIEAFPEDQLFTFSLGGMRPFGIMALELISTGAPTVRGLVTGDWVYRTDRDAMSKADLLRLWDEATAEIDALWAQLRPEAFQEHFTAFGMYPGTGFHLLSYAIDNEVHHRGQGYVYLRALGIEPPPFYERD
jgi:uncharacterized damage-inducible protein DinB